MARLHFECELCEDKKKIKMSCGLYDKDCPECCITPIVTVSEPETQAENWARITEMQDEDL